MADHPNVIVVMCDQLRAFAAGCYGNEFCRTPNIDRLAAEGVRFEHAVTNNPLCTPARACFLSGQYSRTCTGRLGNVPPTEPPNEIGWTVSQAWPDDERTEMLDPTLAEQFRDAGYATAVLGKWHLVPSPELVGFDRSLYWSSVSEPDGRFQWRENGGEPFRVDDFGEEFLARRVTGYLEERTGSDQPFFLFYNINPPHMPFAQTPKKFLEMYSPADVPIRPNVFVDGKLPYDEQWFKIYLWEHEFYWHRQPYTETLPDGYDTRALTAHYYGLVSWVDDLVGRMMAALEANGQAEDTIVVFTAEHGDHLGSHHHWNKGSIIEESIRVPLLVWAPPRWQPQVNDQQVASLIDIMPTLLEAVGADVPESVQGQSLLPILDGRRDSLDQTDAFIELPSGAVSVRTPTHAMSIPLADDRRELSNEGVAFFDVTNDPYEYDNLAGSDRQRDVAEALKACLVEWNSATPWLAREAGA